MGKNNIIITLFILISYNGFSQLCALSYNKELGLKVYKTIDEYPIPNDSIYSFKFDINISSKKHKPNQRIKVAYMVGIDGSSTLIKVIFPKLSKETTKEIEHLISTLPLFKPGLCNLKPVPFHAYVEFPMSANQTNKSINWTSK